MAFLASCNSAICCFIELSESVRYINKKENLPDTRGLKQEPKKLLNAELFISILSHKTNCEHLTLSKPKGNIFNTTHF